MDAKTSARPVWWEERTLGVVTLIAVTTALVFYLDLITPLGLTVWILYFIPLYLTFYVRWSTGAVRRDGRLHRPDRRHVRPLVPRRLARCTHC